MIQTTEITTGEVTRNLEKVFTALDDLKIAVEARPNWEDLGRAEAALKSEIRAEVVMREMQREIADKAIRSLEDWNKWALRTVGGAVLLAGAGWALSGGLIG